MTIEEIKKAIREAEAVNTINAEGHAVLPSELNDDEDEDYSEYFTEENN